METKRAIDILKCFQEPEAWEKQITEEAFDALQMAIDVLSDEGDTISRKAAAAALRERAEALKGTYGDLGGACSGAAKLIDGMPTAQHYTITDGRLWITVDDIDKLDCVVVGEHKSHFGKEFWQDPVIEFAHRWIPCSERLPKNDGRYLVTNTRIGAWQVDIDTFFVGSGWKSDNDPVAWMEKPEAWEGKQ